MPLESADRTPHPPPKRAKIDQIDQIDSPTPDPAPLADPAADADPALSAALPADARAAAAVQQYDAGRPGAIYVDAFNLALDTVLATEPHLFAPAEAAVFAAYRALAYAAQHLCARAPPRAPRAPR